MAVFMQSADRVKEQLVSGKADPPTVSQITEYHKVKRGTTGHETDWEETS